jgi:hypothetical protein
LRIDTRIVGAQANATRVVERHDCVLSRREPGQAFVLRHGHILAKWCDSIALAA